MGSICILEEDITEIRIVDEPTEIIQTEEISVIQIVEVVPKIVTEESTQNVIVEETPQAIIAECKVGPAGMNGLDGFGILQIDSGPVANGVTVNADAVAIATFRSAKWLVTIKDEVAGTYRFYEVIAVHNGTTPLFSVYGLVGAAISVFTDVTIVAGFMRLEVTNNSTNSIDISVMRIVTTV